MEIISGFNSMLQISASSLEKFCELARDLMLTHITEIDVEVLLNARCYAHIRIGFSPFLLDVCLALCCLVFVAPLFGNCCVILVS